MRPNKLIASLTSAALVAISLAFAGDEMTSLSYISYLERYAAVQPANGQQAVDAVVNMPVITGDRLDTARGARLEVQLADGSTLWLDEFTTCDFDALAGSRENPAQRTVLFLQEGTAAIEIPAAALGEDSLRFDYPHGTLFLSKPGLYRFDLRSGKLHVQSHAGLAELPDGIGSALLRAGSEAWLDGQGRVETAAMPAQADDFWAWVQERRSPAPAARTAEVVGTTTAGRVAALDSYGTWVYVDDYSSWAWRPYVQAGWTPYNHGRWYWTPVGWNWISYEPWGWYPYHYGSWFWDVSIGWMWGWDSVWGPAWVHWMYYPGYIGWCPRGYYDWWYHGHGGYHHGGGHPGYPGGPGRPSPARWSEVAYDFSGQVRLSDVDPRPWSMVPANQFTNARLDRVRVEPGRVIGEAGSESRAVVRSGPLVTGPSRGSVERDFDDAYRGRTGSTSDLGSIFRREEQPARSAPGAAGPRQLRTADLVRPASPGGATRGGSGATANDRITFPGGQPAVDLSGGGSTRRTVGREPTSGSTASPAPSRTRGGNEGGGSSATTPARGRDGAPPATAPASEPVAPPAPAAPAATGRSSGAPRARVIQQAPAAGAPAPVPAAPATAAPEGRSPGYASRVRRYAERLTTGDRSWQASGQSSTVSGRTYVVPFEGGQRVVRVTSPEATGNGGTRPGRVSVTSPSQNGSGAASRQPVQVWAPGGGTMARRAPAYSAPSAAAQGGTPHRSYAQAPAGGGAPRQSSAPSSYAPSRSSAAPSGGSSRSSSGHSSGGARASSSGGSRPSGRP